MTRRRNTEVLITTTTNLFPATSRHMDLTRKIDFFSSLEAGTTGLQQTTAATIDGEREAVGGVRIDAKRSSVGAEPDLLRAALVARGRGHGHDAGDRRVGGGRGELDAGRRGVAVAVDDHAASVTLRTR